jgi:DMSO/TMAO reductase YedYZ molybdopterin-dependent catalytic subunit
VQAVAGAKPEASVAGTIPNARLLAEKHPGLKVHSEQPLAGSVPAELHDFDVTPTDRMFIRNNLLTPDLDAARHLLRVHGLVDKPLDLSLADLKELPSFTTQAMLECAGSGRIAFSPTPRGTPWPITGGMGCPAWTGVSLFEVLKLAGVKSNARHAAFSGNDFGAAPTTPKVIRSIPMWKAMERHTMIVWAMNGGDLPRVHGYPLRMLVPGWAGSASIKWLSGIELLDAPFKGPYMDDSYRLPRSPIAPGEKMPTDAVTTEAWPVKSIITAPAPNDRFKTGGRMVVRGSAWAGENGIDKVEVSLDEGVTWTRATLASRRDKYAWRRFTLDRPVEKAGYLTVLARATDDKGNVQPIVSAWNPLGYFWNGVHRVGVLVERA